MNTTRFASASLAALMLVSLTASADTAGEDLGFEVGNYWKYSFEAEIEGLVVSGSMEMKIERIDTLDGKDVFYLDIGSKLVGPDGTANTEVLRDLVHLSAKGYAIWAEAMEPMVAELMREQ